MRVAYADPPYPGCAHLYRDHPDYAGEVDHSERSSPAWKPSTTGGCDTTGHDAAFLRAYLALVEQHMGVYWRRRLAAGLRRRKVRGAAAACRPAGGTLEP